MKSAKSQQYSARRAQREIGEVEAPEISIECDTALLLATFYAERFELASRHRFESWRSDGEELESGGAGGRGRGIAGG